MSSGLPKQAGARGSSDAVRIELGPRSYDVVVGSGVLERAGTLARTRLGARCTRALVVFDDGVPSALLATVERSLSAAAIETFSFPVHASEEGKSLASLDRIVVELTRRRLERKDVVIALGGGVTGDLAGFAAAVYRRGIALVQCPTTLLSMVDASVGGKTGVNVRLAPGDLKKNMIGAFHQPIGVLADVDVLASLDERHFRAGMAECIKHGMIAADFEDPSLQDWMRANAPALAIRDERLLAELITRNVAIKARVVAGDEREESEGNGGRALLNMGHTFGHAIEALPGAQGVLADGSALPGEIHHGEAVALGLRAACECAVQLGFASRDYGSKIGSLIDRFGLPGRVSGLPPTDAILERMSHDKKNIGGSLRLVLPCGESRGTVVENPRMDAVRAAIDTMRT
ncbi:MAG: 3-dehydroquinate synthase [Phycisphaeraceae bacterium]|nr:3-dehydroquinate synthase [Phycisphaeraceae bacterium]